MISKEEARKDPFPYMWVEKGFRILMKRGTKPFMDFANSVDMPTEDIERILNKRKYLEDPEFRKTINDFKKQIKRKMGLVI